MVEGVRAHIVYHGNDYLADREKFSFYFLSYDNSRYAASIVESIPFFPIMIYNLVGYQDFISTICWGDNKRVSVSQIRH